MLSSMGSIAASDNCTFKRVEFINPIQDVGRRNSRLEIITARDVEENNGMPVKDRKGRYRKGNHFVRILKLVQQPLCSSRKFSKVMQTFVFFGIQAELTRKLV